MVVSVIYQGILVLLFCICLEKNGGKSNASEHIALMEVRAYLRNGSVIIVRGDGLEVGQRYFPVDRKVQGVAPELDYFEVEV